MTKYDVIWYWSGGRVEGEWHEATWNVYPDRHNLTETLQAIRNGGRVCHPGTRNIGQPIGPPSEADFKAVGV